MPKIPTGWERANSYPLNMVDFEDEQIVSDLIYVSLHHKTLYIP